MVLSLPPLRIRVETGPRKVVVQERVQPDRCESCHRIPWLCGSCGDYCCGCPLPFLAQRTKNHRLMPRVHYDCAGFPYPIQFVTGYQHERYASDEEDTRWLIEGGIE